MKLVYPAVFTPCEELTGYTVTVPDLPGYIKECNRMSEVKERIIGVVTIMNEDDAAKVWQLIQAAFTLSNAPAAEPVKEELETLEAYHNGDPEYQPFVSQEGLMKQLDL